MDIQQYIASGILENYVLGLVSDEERQEVDRYVQAYPEIKAELAAIEDALGLFAQTKARSMPKGLDAQILSHIEQLANPTDSPKENPPTNTIATEKPTIKNKNKSKGGWLSTLLMVGALTLLGMTMMNGYFQGKLSAKAAEQEQLTQECARTTTQLQAEQQRLQEQITILRNDAYRSILLKGTPKAPDAIAAIYYNETANKTYLDIRNLPSPTADKQYQLWAIVDGAPVDMGVFDLPLDTVEFVEVPHIANAQAFAVTLEPKGGQAAPTMEEMYVIGNT